MNTKCTPQCTRTPTTFPKINSHQPKPKSEHHQHQPHQKHYISSALAANGRSVQVEMSFLAAGSAAKLTVSGSPDGGFSVQLEEISHAKLWFTMWALRELALGYVVRSSSGCA